MWDKLGTKEEDDAWLVAGDFNNVLRMEEREDGSDPQVQELQPFGDCLQDYRLTYMSY